MDERDETKMDSVADSPRPAVAVELPDPIEPPALVWNYWPDLAEYLMEGQLAAEHAIALFVHGSTDDRVRDACSELHIVVGRSGANQLLVNLQVNLHRIAFRDERGDDPLLDPWLIGDEVIRIRVVSDDELARLINDGLTFDVDGVDFTVVSIHDTLEQFGSEEGDLADAGRALLREAAERQMAESQGPEDLAAQSQRALVELERSTRQRGLTPVFEPLLPRSMQ